MQVFAPSSVSFQECARILDNKRLQKQLLEASLMLETLSGKPNRDGKPRTGWMNHPALTAWRHNLPALAAYAIACADECSKRNIKNDLLRERVSAYLETSYTLPAWWGDERIHASHRARLLNKDFRFYEQCGWEEAKRENLTDSNYQWAIWVGESATEYVLEERKSKLSPKQREEHSRLCERVRQLQRDFGYLK